MLVVKADSPVKGLADLKGKTVGLQAGSSTADALESATDFKASLNRITSYNVCYTKLLRLVDGKYWQFKAMRMNNLESGGNTLWEFTKSQNLAQADEKYFTLRFLERGR